MCTKQLLTSLSCSIGSTKALEATNNSSRRPRSRSLSKGLKSPMFEPWEVWPSDGCKVWSSGFGIGSDKSAKSKVPNSALIAMATISSKLSKFKSPVSTGKKPLSGWWGTGTGFWKNTWKRKKNQKNWKKWKWEKNEKKKMKKIWKKWKS